MKKLLKPLKSKAMLRIVVFATLFVLMDTLIEMNQKTEEQVTYSITLEDLASANVETDGETGTPGPYDKFKQHSEDCPNSTKTRKWCTNDGIRNTCKSVSCAS